MGSQRVASGGNACDARRIAAFIANDLRRHRGKRLVVFNDQTCKPPFVLPGCAARCHAQQNSSRTRNISKAETQNCQRFDLTKFCCIEAKISSRENGLFTTEILLSSLSSASLLVRITGSSGLILRKAAIAPTPSRAGIAPSVINRRTSLECLRKRATASAPFAAVRTR